MTSKSILISIRPQWCELIAIGAKTLELRKSCPNTDVPVKCYIYQTKRKWIYKWLEKLGLYQGKVIGEFVCDWIKRAVSPENGFVDVADANMACLTIKEIIEYSNGKTLYGWHISELVIYDKPRELREFGLTRPPMSWGYVQEGKTANEEREEGNENDK